MFRIRILQRKKLAKFEEAGGELKVEDNKIVGGLLGKSGNGPNHLIGVIRDKIKKAQWWWICKI